MTATTSGSTTNDRKGFEKSFLHSRRKKLIMQKCINCLGSKAPESKDSDSPCATSGPLLLTKEFYYGKWLKMYGKHSLIILPKVLFTSRPYPWPYPFPLPCTGASNEQNLVPHGISP
uniref:PH domain-containing protein n=1 Tax=Steinernema glaseri TaxID=37863 RepID=A0A1I7Y1P4_9BILA